ncbi:ribonuclease HII [Candidatus Woesearchaeota archaeon]|nr:ribonuclease HII [Candidatus Woesearchaeota archaeon]
MGAASLCGIDEAGRGPVIGPLVIAGVLINEDEQDQLRTLGAKDSKLLTNGQRERLFEVIKKAVLKYHIITIPPADIDHAVESDLMNLNWLEAHKSVEIINELKPDKAILDSPSPNTTAYTSHVREYLDNPHITIISEHKADVNYPAVSAASILAKVTRDREIEAIKKRIGIDFGSGYLTDPKTQAFLKSHWDTHHELFRHSWEPYKKIAGLKGQRGIKEFTE